MSSMVQVNNDQRSPARRWSIRILLAVVIAGFATFWIWALFFASKEAVNRVADRDWAARAEGICAEANEQRALLSDYRSIVDGEDTALAELIRERAEIVDRATDILDEMLDEVVAVAPTDDKGRAIVPQWEAEYRSYLAGRRDYADQLRDSGENLPFYEPGSDGIPVSERLETFAGDNEMPSCAPPRDLTR